MTRRHLYRAVGSLAALAVTAALGTVAVGPATSASDTSCPAAVPVHQVRANEAVNGLTVSSGTTPQSFTGTVIGTLQDGIAPGVDMILVKFSSPEINRVGGIWEGMSGSPVYAPDGRLIGAVAYGLSYGPSPVAGVTPAVDMRALLGGGGTPVTAARKVRLPKALARKVVAAGGATRSQVAGGYSPIKTPLVVSGLHDRQRRADLAKGLHLSGRVLAGASSSHSSPSYGIAAGGNLVAGISYGEVTAGAVGTATMVCGRQVVGFGHPFNFIGRTSYTMHGADAVYVQADSLGSPYKLVNLGAPVGTVTGDHLVGIAGATQVLPKVSRVTSNASLGSRQRRAVTWIPLPVAVPDIAVANVVSDQDRVLDYVGKGRSKASWTIRGTQADGTPFSVSRSDYYSDESDISYTTVSDLADELNQIASAQPGLRIDSVTTDSQLNRQPGTFRIKSVQARIGRVWTQLGRNTVLNVRPGTTRWLRVALASSTFQPRTVRVALRIPRGPAGASGYANVFGGGNNMMGGGFLYFDDGGSPSSLGSVLQHIKHSPHHNQVVAQVRMRGAGGWKKKLDVRRDTRHVVTGERSFMLRMAR